MNSPRALKKIALLGILACVGVSCFCIVASAPESALQGGTKQSSNDTSMIPHPAPSSSMILKNINSEKVNPFEFYVCEPAPMGIADFGINPSNNSAYEYNTTSFLGTALISSFSTTYGYSDHGASIQLNVVLKFKVDSVLYAYWLQNVVQIDTSTRNVMFLDNVWNFSSPAAILLPSGMTGNGQISTYYSNSWYWDRAILSMPGNNIDIAYPSSILLQINATVDGNGHPKAIFSYNDGFGWQSYDQVIFLANGTHVQDWNLIVDGFHYTPMNYLFYDAEFVIGGEYGGLSTSLVNSNMSFSLEYYNGNNMEEIPSSFNFGSNTGEAISHAVVQADFPVFGGKPFEKIVPGAGAMLAGWDPATIATGNFSFSGLSGGILRIGHATYSFQGSKMQIVIHPGTYNITLNTVFVDNFTFSAGLNDISLRHGPSSINLDYGKHLSVTWASRLGNTSRIAWSFSDPDGVGIQVWALDAYNYSIFNSGGSISGYRLSNGSFSNDSSARTGDYSPPLSDNWFIVFWNNDSLKMASTNLTYSASCHITPASPGAITNLAALASTKSLIFNWFAPYDGGSAITSYKVYRSTVSGGENYYGSCFGSSFHDFNVTKGVVYYYYIKAANSIGTGSPSNEIRVSLVNGPGKYLNITNPTSSSSWTEGNTYKITWISSDTCGYVDIYLCDESGNPVSTIATFVNDTGQCSWMMSLIDLRSGYYSIFLEDSHNNSLNAYSSIFRIVSLSKFIEITNPYYSSWTIGTSHSIEWISSGTSGHVNIALYDSNGTFVSTIAFHVPDSGSYYWTIPTTGLLAGVYKIFIEDSSNSNISCNSSIFYISSSFIDITNPTSTSSWFAGNSYAIEWTSSGTSGLVDIYLVDNTGNLVAIIARATSANGTCNWTIPSRGLASGFYRILIEDYYYFLYAFSDSFNITFSSHYIVILNPSSYANWMAGTSYYISWTSSGTSGHVDIDMWDIYGNYAATIASNVPDCGYFYWHIPSLDLSNSIYMIFIQDSYNASIHAIAQVLIYFNYIDILNPAYTSTWISGNTYSIEWTSSGTSGRVTIYLDEINGTYISTIAVAIVNNGSYHWTIPSSGISSGFRIIYIFDPSDNGNSGYSYVFYIANASNFIEIMNPAHYIYWVAGGFYWIEWTASGTSGHMDIALIDSNGHSRFTIASHVIDKGCYYWKVPINILQTGYYKIQIRDSANSSISNQSDSFFIFASRGLITITNPTSSSTWIEGELHVIEWISKFTSGYLSIYLEDMNGKVVATIASRILDNGTCAWTIPTNLTAGSYKILVVDVFEAGVSARSGTFIITNPMNLALITTQVIPWVLLGVITVVALVYISKTTRLKNKLALLNAILDDKNPRPNDKPIE